MISKRLCSKLIPTLAVATVWLEVWLARTDSTGKNAFRVLGDLRMSPTFADLRALTAAANCSGWQSQVVNGADMSCDLYGRFGDLGYPPYSVAALSVLGIKEASTGIVAIVIATIFLGLTWWIFLFRSKRPLLSATMMSITVAGFPTLLALERMNIDVAIFICLIGVSLLFDSSVSPRPQGTILQASKNLLILVISASIVSWKIYPIFGLVTLAVAKTPKSVGTQKSTWISLIVGSLAGLAAIGPWLLQGENIPAPGLGIISHGFLGTELPEKISAALIVVACIWTASSRPSDQSAIKHKYWKQNIAAIRRIPSLYLSCTATWIISFLVTRSYDYRLIFIYPAIAYMCRSDRNDRGIEVMKTIAMAIFAILMVAAMIYFPLDSVNLGIKESMSSSIGKSLPHLLKISSWWIGRLLDLGGTTVMAILICLIMASDHRGANSRIT